MCNVCLAKEMSATGMGATGMSRRLFVGAGAGMLAAAPMIGTAQAQPAREAATPDAALKLLVEGNARYASGKLNERDFSATRAARVQGQKPFAAILSCADSRVAPELAFDRGPGELFVVRVAGNFVSPDGLASLEYGAAVLGTKVIMVLGHTSCGAINATVEALQKGNQLPGAIAGLVTAMKPGIESVMKTPGTDLEQRAVVANVRYNVQRLIAAKPILADMIAAGKLRVVGGFYNLATGKVEMV